MIKNNNNSFSAVYNEITSIGKIYKGTLVVYESFKNLLASGVPPLKLLKCKGVDLLDYKLYGNSVQDGTPTPTTPIEVESVGNLVTDESDTNYGKYEIPIKVAGKNLLPYPFPNKSKTEKGITWTDNGDGTITANGTATGESKFTILSNGTSILPMSKTLSLSGCPKGGSRSTYHIVQTNHGAFDVGDGTYIYPSYTYANWYEIVIKKGVTVENLVFKPQIEVGTKTEFEPYQKPMTSNIYLNGPLRKVGDYVDYVDFKKEKVFRNVEVIDDTGTVTIEESLKGVIDDTGTPIELPNIPTIKGTTILSVDTTIQPSNLEVVYKGKE